ncbi:hypothetical protein [Pseudomonas putida]|uniref:hypothetical protein n=1 Tax=Pseudomonas putida TaxID=303 RepID=UPI003D9554AA
MLNSRPINATHIPTSSNPSSTPLFHTRLSAQVLTTHQGQRSPKLPDNHARHGATGPAVEKGGIVFPAYCGGGIETPWDVIKDQQSFNETCTFVETYLSTHQILEEEFLYALDTGFFQRPLGRASADLFVDAVMRSIRPLGEWTTGQLREMVEALCKLPPGEWANAFGERLSFSPGNTSNSVAGFIQSQLALSRLQRDGKIANDELLTDVQWQELQAVVKDCRSSIRPWVEGRLNSTLMKLEDCAKDRRSPEEIKFLLGEFLQRLNEPRGERFPERHKRAVEGLWQSIRLKPTPTLLDEFKEWIDPAWVQTGMQRVVKHTNSALNSLGALTAKDLGQALYKGANSVITPLVSTASMASFAFRTAPRPQANEDKVTDSENDFSLMQTLEEIERKGDYYTHVHINGPRMPNGLAARLLYAGYIAHEASGIASSLRPNSPKPPKAQTSPLPPEPQKPASVSINPFAQLEPLVLAIDEFFTRTVQGVTGWSPVAAVKFDDLGKPYKEIKEQLMQAQIKTPFASAPSSSYGSVGNPYVDTVEQLQADSLETLRAGLAHWLQATAGYLTSAGVATWKIATIAVEQHPYATATAALIAIYAAVNEFYKRWFGQAAMHPQAHFATEAPPRQPEMIVDELGSIQSYRSDAELVDERIFEPRNHYAHLQFSRLEVDENGNTYIETEEIAASSDQKDPADDSSLWVPEALSDAQITQQADQNLQTRVQERLEASQDRPLSVPEDSSMNRPLALLRQTLNDPAVLAWFESKGLVLDTLSIYRDSVSGTVIRDGVSSTQTFSLWDDSGWWRVSTSVLAARQVLDPGNFGLPFVDDNQNLIPCAVILDFFKVVPPTSDKEAGTLADRLKKEGWPPFTSDDKAVIDQECNEVTTLIAETKGRAQLGYELKMAVENLPDDAPLLLSGRYTRSANYLPLADKCAEKVEVLNKFLTLPRMLEICEGLSIDCSNSPVRISDNKIQVQRSMQWYDLTALVSAESSLSIPFAQLLQAVKETGNTLYSTLSMDLQQVINYRGFGSPKTAGEVRNVMHWLNTTLPGAPPLGDYGADLLGDAQSIISLTPEDRAKIINLQAGFFNDASSIIDALGADLLGDTSVEYRRTHVDQLLEAMFEKDQAVAWGHELLNTLDWYGAGQTALPEHYQKLLLAAIKVKVDPDVPGRPGTVAGYDVYQPKNLGRDLAAVRAEIERHLVDNKGVSARAAPLIAHVFLADAAPEFLTRDTDKGLQMGTANWMALRLGTAIAEIQEPGCSRVMDNEQLMALALLIPTTPEQQLLFKTAAADILVAWGVMNGVVHQRADALYSPADYLLAANRFASQRAELSQAIDGFKTRLETRKEIAVRELGKIFSFLTTETVDDIKIKANVFTPLDRFTPISTVEKTLVEAYMDGDLFTRNWVVTSTPIEQALFDRAVRVLPVLNDLLTSSVDRFFNARKSGFVVTTQSLIAALPLETRQCLEQGEVKLFTLREETGKPKEDETATMQAAFRGRYGTLLRCEYQQKVRYFEFFPGRMLIIERTDLPDDLPLEGVTRIEKARVSKGSTVNVDVQRGTQLPFDFSAYSQGTAPAAGAQSNKLIIEPLGGALPGTTANGSGQSAFVPDSYSSSKTGNIVDRIINGNYLQGERDFLFKKARGQTTADENRAYWEKVENFLVKLIPFVGCTDDLQSEDRMRFINGAFGCFTDLVSGLSALAGGAAKISKTLNSVVPVSIKAFEAVKVTGTTVISMINPLDGLPDLIVGGGRAIGSLRKVLTSGVFTLTQAGTSHLQACVDRLRGFFGGMVNGASTRLPRSVTTSLGRVNGTETLATQIDNKWYVLDTDGYPIGRALDKSKVLPL